MILVSNGAGLNENNNNNNPKKQSLLLGGVVLKASGLYLAIHFALYKFQNRLKYLHSKMIKMCFSIVAALANFSCFDKIL